MFERSLQTREWLDAEAREGRTPDEIRARRIAAAIIAINAVVGFGFSLLVSHGALPLLPLGSMLVGLALAVYLYKLRPRAESFAIALVILWSTALPLVYFLQIPLVYALVQSLVIWGLAGALLLLLVGRPSRRRQALAVALYVLVCATFGLAVAYLLFWR
jgi:hypothetical protein